MAINFTHEDWQMHATLHKILVADDADFKRGEIAGIAFANGFGCDLAKSAPEAWSKLTSGKTSYDLMIADNSMPPEPSIGPDGYNYSSADGLDALDPRHSGSGNEGLQLVRRIRQDPDFGKLEIIVFTGSGVGAQAEALGARYVQTTEMYLLNDILRERSELYREATQAPREKRKRVWDILR